MQIIKSLHSVTLHSTFRYMKKNIFCVSVGWGFKCTDPEKALLEVKIWPTMTKYGTTVFDECRPKKTPEMIVVGNAIKTSNGSIISNKDPMQVNINMQNINKQLLINGDRQWNSFGQASPAKPFSEMPLSQEFALGGKEDQLNPLGKGVDKIDDEFGDKIQELPNIEYQFHKLSSPSDQAPPAYSFPEPPDFPSRTKKIGTHDDHYLKHSFPGYADDIDWSFFNTCPKDQWFDQPLKGDEAFSITGMNAEHPILNGNLPGVKARAFVNQKVEIGDTTQTDLPEYTDVFKEIPLTLDTLWFFPNDDLCMVMYRGTMEVSDSEGKDISKLMTVHENINETKRDATYYSEQMDLRSDPDESYKYTLYTMPLLPEGYTFKLSDLTGDDQQDLALEEALNNFAENKKIEVLQEIEEQKQNAKEKLSEIDASPEYLEQLENAGKPDPNQEPSDIELKIKELINKLLPGADQPEATVDDLDLTQLDFSVFDEIDDYMALLEENEKQKAIDQLIEQRSKLEQKPDLPGAKEGIAHINKILLDMTLLPILVRPSLTETQEELKQQIAQINEYLDKLDEEHRKIAKDQFPDISKTFEQISEAEQQAKDGYRQSAHFTDETRSAHPGEEEAIVQTLLQRYEAGESCAEFDLSFCDLSDLNLAGIDLSGAYFEYAILKNTNFDNANLNNAIFAKANISHCSFINSDLNGANLGAAIIKHSIFENNQFEEVTFGKSSLENTQFKDCDFGKRLDLFLDTDIKKCHFINSILKDHNFIEINVSHCLFDSCDLSATNFIKSTLTETDFKNSDISGSNFLVVKAEHTKFNHAKAINSRFLGDSILNHASFQHADFSASCFREAELKHSNFSEGCFDKCDFGQAKLNRARAKGASFIEANLMEADLRLGDFSHANFMESSLMKANLISCDLKYSSFYGANLIGVTMGDTAFRGANLEMTILKDWHP